MTIIPDFSLTVAEALYSSDEEFPVDFDWVWNWLEYSTKASAKRVLLREFTEGEDYQINISVDLRPQGGYAEREDIFLTVNCLKEMGMMRGTEKGRMIRRYFIYCEQKLKEIVQQPHLPPYWYDRLTLFNQRTHIPHGWFCIFKEIADFVSDMEAQGYQLPDDARLDASVGRHFCKYLRSIGIEPKEVCVKYDHWYPGYSFPVKAWLYPRNLLLIFREWFEDVYLMSHVKAYFKGRSDQQGLAAVNRCLMLLSGG